jgi:vacuolar-type H+-ATPase subunit H
LQFLETVEPHQLFGNVVFHSYPSCSSKYHGHQTFSALQAINKALDETKDNIRRTTDEARKDIPRYTQIVNEYQEETIQAARQIADNYLESQREIINSMQSAMVPPIEAANKAVTSNWTSPRNVTEH